MEIIDVVFPCLNEAPALPRVLSALPPGYRAVVADNGSSDGSPEVAEAHGALVVREPMRGYGAAVHTGLLACEAELVCVLDADGSLNPAVLPGLVDAVRGGADLALGRRRPRGAGSWPWHARMGNAVLAGMLRHAGLSVRDVSPIRAAYRERLLGLGVTDRGFGYPLELLLRAARAGWRIQERDVPYLPRAAGTRSKVTSSAVGTIRAIRDMAGVLTRVPK